MADTGWLYPDYVVSDGVGGEAWINPSNALTSNEAWASSTLTSTECTKRLRAYTFSANLPAGATVLGIEAGFERHQGAGDTHIKDYAVRLMDDTTVKGDNKADTGTAWPTTDANAFYGGAADLWGASWTRDQVNASTFGVTVRAKAYGALDNETPYIDVIAVKITYSVVSSTDHLMIMGM